MSENVNIFQQPHFESS